MKIGEILVLDQNVKTMPNNKRIKSIQLFLMKLNY